MITLKFKGRILAHCSIGCRVHVAHCSKIFSDRNLRCSAALATRSQTTRPRKLEAEKETDSLEWGKDTIKLSDKLKRRLGKREHLSPEIALGEKTLQQRESASPEELRAKDDVLDLTGLRPVTGETLAEEHDQLQASATAKIKSADYIKSSLRAKDWPKAKLPEIAVIGRSNVGKSSLINMLTGRKELALVSKTPGKTRTINHFLINKSWYLVDLPGYGYAKTSRDSRFTWGKYTQQFFLTRPSLLQVLLLVDATVPTQDIDLDCAQWLFENSVPFSVVYTKLDKRKKKCPPAYENVAKFEEELSGFMPVLPGSVATSATEKQGKDELLLYLAQLRRHAGIKV